MRARPVYKLALAAALAAALTGAPAVYGFLGFDTETEHKVIVTNSSGSQIRTAGGHYYQISLTSPCSNTGGRTNNVLTFDRTTLNPGETAVARYRTTQSMKVEVIHTEWYKSGGPRQFGLSCEVKPRTCGNDNTKDWKCTFNNGSISAYDAGGTGTGTFR